MFDKLKNAANDVPLGHDLFSDAGEYLGTAPGSSPTRDQIYILETPKIERLKKVHAANRKPIAPQSLISQATPFYKFPMSASAQRSKTLGYGILNHYYKLLSFSGAAKFWVETPRLGGKLLSTFSSSRAIQLNIYGNRIHRLLNTKWNLVSTLVHEQKHIEEGGVSVYGDDSERHLDSIKKQISHKPSWNRVTQLYKDNIELITIQYIYDGYHKEKGYSQMEREAITMNQLFGISDIEFDWEAKTMFHSRLGLYYIYDPAHPTFSHARP